MLNFSTRAIENLLVTRKAIPTDPEKQAIDDMIHCLRTSVKFELPDRGELIYGLGHTPVDLEMGRLPFPVIAIEFPYSPEEDVLPDETFNATRRLIIAQEMVVDIEKGKLAKPEAGEEPNCVCVDVIITVQEANDWTLQPIAGIVMIGEKATRAIGDAETDPYHEGRIKNGATFTFAAFDRLPTIGQMIRDKGNRLYEHTATNDLGAELCILGEFLAVLSCSNVTTELKPIPPKLAKARSKAGKEPFHDIHVLVVQGKQVGTNEDNWTMSDEGYKVREHVRRGHIRNLSDGRKVWVNHTLVAAGSKAGQAEKIYKVK